MTSFAIHRAGFVLVCWISCASWMAARFSCGFRLPIVRSAQLMAFWIDLRSSVAPEAMTGKS